MELGRDEGGKSPSGGEEDKEVLKRLQDEEDDDDDEGTRQPYNCAFCKRGFPTAQALGGHMNVHRKDRGRAVPTVAGRITCSYEPALVDGFTRYDQTAYSASGSEAEARRSLLHAERSQQELRLFGQDGAGRGKEGGARDRRDHHFAKDGDGDDHDEQGEEGLDLELRLGGAGQ